MLGKIAGGSNNYQQIVFEATGLLEGSYTIRIERCGQSNGNDKINIDAFEVF